jgi:hypothetical protein
MKCRILALFAGCLLMQAAASQIPDSLLGLYCSRYTQEKIHIHFDKDAYLPGETVWMKAYLFSESKPSYISKNIYFDWTDSRGRLLLHSVSPVSEGTASSSFIIPSGLENGVVHVKAYTQWMLNFDDDFLYNKDIPVLIPSNAGNDEPEKRRPEIRFFAEGGDLVNGVSSVVAFEALDQHGKPVNVNGAIMNSSNQVLDSFHTAYCGMGSFTFRPVAGETYQAVWKDESGEMHSTLLPQPRPNGVVLHTASDKKDEIRFTVERSVDAVSLNRLSIMGTIGQQVVYRSNLNLSNLKTESSIATASFPCGIMQLTVFDSDMSPLAERVVFVNNRKPYGNVRMQREVVNLNKRARNEISVEIPDSLTTNLSVSVTDGGLGEDSSYNIYSDLLLSGDLRGAVGDAASLLDNNNAHAANHLNLVLLTHGWRRFNWEAVVSGKLPTLKYLHDADFLTLKGEIRATAAALDGEDSVALLLISKDRKKHVLNLPVNADGKFNQRGLYFYDSVQIAYRFNHPAKLNSETEFNLYADLLPPLTPARASESGYAWMKVPEVVLEKELGGNIVETNSYAVPSDAMSYIFSPGTSGAKGNSETVTHYLTTMFADLRFPATLKDRERGTGEARLAAYSAGNPAARNNVNISFDGVPVGMDDLKSMSMREVLFIKFVPRTNPKGLPTLAISGRQTQEQNSILESKTGFAVITGYTPVREFYAPRYAAADKVSDYAASDFRTTLYWNPQLKLDRSHRKVKLVFYNNDVSNKFRVVIEGMNQEGKLTRIEELIK